MNLLSALQAVDAAIIGVDGPNATAIPPTDPTTTITFQIDAAFWRATWNAPPTQSQQNAARTAIQNYAPAFADKILNWQDLAFTVAALVEAVVRIKVNAPANLAGLNQQYVDQLAKAHTFIQNQGG